MQYIVLDLEATSIPHKVPEIISFGAYKVGVEYQITYNTVEKRFHIQSKLGEINDKFYSLVKPVFTSITKYIEKLTQITQEELENQELFDINFNNFINWSEENDKDILFVTWSNSDFKMLKKNCNLHFIPFNKDKNIFVDLQRIYDIKNKNKQKTSLKKALTTLDFEFTGQQHNALDDSYNTVQILRKIYQDI